MFALAKAARASSVSLSLDITSEFMAEPLEAMPEEAGLGVA